MADDKAAEVVVVEEPEVEVVNDENSLSPMELELAKKQGIDVTVEDKPVDDKPVAKVADKPVDKPLDIPVEDLDSFEKLHDLYQSNPETFYKLPRNIKQLYHSQKGLYKRAKEEEEKRKKFEDDLGLNKIQNSVAKIKLDRIKNRLANPEGLTVEELQELLEEKREVENNADKPLTAKDLEAHEAKKREEAEKQTEEERNRQVAVAARIAEAETYAKANLGDLTGGKYENFDDIVALAQEMVKSKPRYGAQIASVINGEADVQEIVDVIVDIAKLSPKWGTSAKTDKTDDKSVDRIVKNAGRQQTSATLSGGRGGREIHISEDMDPEDAARVWDKIPRELRHKILRKL
jgi:hypothetical protein